MRARQRCCGARYIARIGLEHDDVCARRSGCAAADPAEPIAVTSAATTRAVPVFAVDPPLVRPLRATILVFVTKYH